MDSFLQMDISPPFILPHLHDHNYCYDDKILSGEELPFLKVLPIGSEEQCIFQVYLSNGNSVKENSNPNSVNDSTIIPFVEECVVCKGPCCNYQHCVKKMLGDWSKISNDHVLKKKINNCVPIYKEFNEPPSIVDDHIFNEIVDGPTQNPNVQLEVVCMEKESNVTTEENLQIDPTKKFRDLFFLNKKEERKGKTKKKILKCWICLKTIENKRRLEKHVAVHLKPNLECKCCQKVYKKLKYLRRHKCQSGRPTECDYCYMASKNSNKPPKQTGINVKHGIDGNIQK